VELHFKGVSYVILLPALYGLLLINACGQHRDSVTAQLRTRGGIWKGFALHSQPTERCRAPPGSGHADYCAPCRDTRTAPRARGPAGAFFPSMLSRAPPCPLPKVVVGGGQTFVFDSDNDKIKYYPETPLLQVYCKHKVPLTHPRHLCGTLTVCMYTTRLNEAGVREAHREGPVRTQVAGTVKVQCVRQQQNSVGAGRLRKGEHWEREW
jgi:hypothetical protein